MNVEIACLLCNRLLCEWRRVSLSDARRQFAQLTLRRVRCVVCGGPPVVAEITQARRDEPKLEAALFRVKPGRQPKQQSEHRSNGC